MKKIFYILSICVMTILQPSCDALDLENGHHTY